MNKFMKTNSRCWYFGKWSVAKGGCSGNWHLFLKILAVAHICCILLLCNVAEAKIIWCNPANTGTQNGIAKSSGYNTLWNALAAMISGDTVIVAKGDWSSFPGMSIDDKNIPPSGTAAAYSRVVAEIDWGVRLHHCSTGQPRSYVEIRGFVFDSRTTPTPNIVYDWNHTKFIRCGFLVGRITGNNHTCGFGSADSTRSLNQYNLMEECIAWGGGRYVFYSKYGKYNIFRRCVARHDSNEDDGQIANFRGYAVSNTVYQNCISVDTDRKDNYNGGVLSTEASGFWVGDQYGTDGNIIIGSISIKDLQMPFYLAGGGTGTTTITDSVALSPTEGVDTLSAFILKSNVNVVATRVLGVDATGVDQDGFYGKNGGTLTATDCILRDVADCRSCGTALSTTVYWNTAGEAGMYNIDPFSNGLLYPVRVESGSPLTTMGVSGGQVGPTILKKIGVSGTLYGETGWDTVTDDNLWPFPNEAKIKELMSTTVGGVSGVYGFTAGTSKDGSPQTLTKYIWEHFGNQIPKEVYLSASPEIYSNPLNNQ